MTADEIAREATERAQREARQAAVDLADVLRTAQGRRVVWRLLERCGIYEASFRGDQAEWTVFRDARRQLGVDLIADCEAALPGVYWTMGRENAERVAHERAEAEKHRAALEADAAL